MQTEREQGFDAAEWRQLALPELLRSITPSMSRKGNCWDNACSETLFSSLKVERLHGQRFQTIREAKYEVIAWLLWYNRTRMHSTLNYVSPMQFEQDWTDAAAKIAA
jgi:putative transposase